MKITQTDLAGVLVIQPRRFPDSRGNEITVKTDDTTEPTPLPGDPTGTDVAAA